MRVTHHLPYLLLLTFVSSTATELMGLTARYRCMWRDDPATTMVIGWDQVSGSNPVLHFDEIDYGGQANAYRYRKAPDRFIRAKGMQNQFVRLTGLKPNTVYYFVIQDSEGMSKRMSFKTTPNNPNQPLSIIAGGDSRNNRQARVTANRLVSKLRPHFVIFNGDMTGGDTNENWRDWFDDWQETIGSDGRLFPIVTSRGNHERENASITELFDVPSIDVYYALTFGGDLFRLYTLNSMIAPAGSQAIWLEGDLEANQHVTWKMAQYHHGMRPHTRGKPEKDELYNNWARLFYTYEVDLVLESDAHVVKTTYPLRPFRGAGSDQGFIRDDERGTVYVGEGCWGAPLRNADDAKEWTRAHDSFNQFKWIFVMPDRIEVRTVKTDESLNVAEVSHNNLFEIPLGLNVWTPSTGDVVYIQNDRIAQTSRQPIRDAVRERIQERREERLADNNPAPPETVAPPSPAQAEPSDPNDWSPYTKVMPDAQNFITVKFTMPRPGPVAAQLIDREYAIRDRFNIPAEKPGERVKKFPVNATLPKGEYLLIIRSGKEVLRKYQVVKR
ncbi:metallophosphoesterase family protein [Phaeodactylibacter sp.]|jgi:hypothetical protein|uniref:purple acid phosphatase family protein n=1 Tax=Phaeodactylibacter sp. TaxID=1940289 RepID=UPI0025E73922|nr:metallophosphoesterase family protein [Phaeodactylibacter sp.]MCI4646785.1 metallophosphoesterase family protein [Phaeodactylibacter sp.]MCI5091740.1 metallophosphoesterase family protein [Phaeodactylibacter sp.]